MSAPTVTLTDSDGNTVTISNCTINDELVIDESEDITAGGRITTQQTGYRYKASLENVRMTDSEYKALVAFLTNGANYYTYEPSVTPDMVASTEFPMRMRIRRPSKRDQAWNGGKLIYFDLECEGVEYV